MSRRKVSVDAGQLPFEAHSSTASVGSVSTDIDQCVSVSHRTVVDIGNPSSNGDHSMSGSHVVGSVAIAGSPVGNGHVTPEAHGPDAIVDNSPDHGHHHTGDHVRLAAVGAHEWRPMEPYRLRGATDNLDDIERTRIAVENRLRARLLELGAIDPKTKTDIVDVVYALVDAAEPRDAITEELGRTASIVAGIRGLEVEATKEVSLALRAHPLGPWAAKAKGVGPKQGGRLIAAIGDPYVRIVVDEFEDRAPTVFHFEPRRGPAQLWAYCGYAVSEGVAVRRQKGQKANWSPVAKSRAYLIADGCKKFRCGACVAAGKEAKANSAKGVAEWAPPPVGCTCPADFPYRAAYDAARIKYAGAVHERECVRCGPTGKPALVGSPLQPGHCEARAVRLVAKQLLQDLWCVARDWHAEHGHTSSEPHSSPATLR